MTNALCAPIAIVRLPKLLGFQLMLAFGMFFWLMPLRCAAQVENSDPCRRNGPGSSECLAWWATYQRSWKEEMAARRAAEARAKDEEIARMERELDVEKPITSLHAEYYSQLKANRPLCLHALLLLNPDNERDLPIPACEIAEEAYEKLKDFANLALFHEDECKLYPFHRGYVPLYPCGDAGNEYLHADQVGDRRQYEYPAHQGGGVVGPDQDVPRGLKLLARPCSLYGDCYGLAQVFDLGVRVFKVKERNYLGEVGHSVYSATNEWAVPPDPARALVYYRLDFGAAGDHFGHNSSKVTPEQLAAARESLVREGLLPRTQVLSLSSLASEVEIVGSDQEWKVQHRATAKDQDEIYPADAPLPTVVFSLSTQDCASVISRKPGWKLINHVEFVPDDWHNQVLLGPNVALACLPLSGKALQARIFDVKFVTGDRVIFPTSPLWDKKEDAVRSLLSQIGAAARKKYSASTQKQAP